MEYSEGAKELLKTWPTLANEAEYITVVLTPGQSILVPKGRVVRICCNKDVRDKKWSDDKPVFWITWNWGFKGCGFDSMKFEMAWMRAVISDLARKKLPPPPMLFDLAVFFAARNMVLNLNKIEVDPIHSILLDYLIEQSKMVKKIGDENECVSVPWSTDWSNPTSVSKGFHSIYQDYNYCDLCCRNLSNFYVSCKECREKGKFKFICLYCAESCRLPCSTRNQKHTMELCSRFQKRVSFDCMIRELHLRIRRSGNL
jgi:hypothetical protein